jgi:hypothetical protein
LGHVRHAPRVHVDGSSTEASAQFTVGGYGKEFNSLL